MLGGLIGLIAAVYSCSGIAVVALQCYDKLRRQRRRLSITREARPSPRPLVSQRLQQRRARRRRVAAPRKCRYRRLAANYLRTGTAAEEEEEKEDPVGYELNEHQDKKGRTCGGVRTAAATSGQNIETSQRSVLKDRLV